MEQMNERRYACARSCAAERLGAFEAPPLKAAKTTLAGSSDAAVRNAEHGGERENWGRETSRAAWRCEGSMKTRHTRQPLLHGRARRIKGIEEGLRPPFYCESRNLLFSCARRPVGFQNNEGL